MTIARMTNRMYPMIAHVLAHTGCEILIWILFSSNILYFSSLEIVRTRDVYRPGASLVIRICPSRLG